jgi:hypothetical protein
MYFIAPTRLPSVVYYVQFDAETYVPVTRDDIGAESSRRVCLGDATFAREVEALLGHGKPDGFFEERKVRLLFVSGDRRKSFMSITREQLRRTVRFLV